MYLYVTEVYMWYYSAGRTFYIVL